MMFVAYANGDGHISDTIIKWKKGRPNTPKRIERLRRSVAAQCNQSNPSEIRIINWRLLKG